MSNKDIGLLTTATSIETSIKNYNLNHDYIHFSSSVSLLGNGEAIISNYDLGCIVPAEGSNSSPIQDIIHLFDNNLHTEYTAKYNVGLRYSDLKWKEQEYLTANMNSLKMSPGLLITVVDAFYNLLDVHYFTKKRLANEVLYTNAYSDDLSSINSALNRYNDQHNLKQFFFVEWFGYFQTPDKGNYQFEIISNDGSIMWFDDNALVSFSLENATIHNVGLGNQTKKSNIINIVSNKLYPIRIQYGKLKSEPGNDAAFQFKIYKQREGGSFELIPTTKGYFKTVADQKNQPYEPFQMFYALKQNNGLPNNKSNHSKYNLYVTIIDSNTWNNYNTNNVLRLAKSNPSLTYNILWASTAIPATSTGTNNANKTTALLDKKGDIILLQNGNIVSNITSIPGLVECVDAKICDIQMTLGNDGNIIIQNRVDAKILWSLFASQNITPIKTPRDAVINLNWIATYIKYKEKGTDLSTISAGYNIDPSGNIPFLLSPNGKFKLMVEYGNIILKYTRQACRNHLRQTKYTVYNDLNDNNAYYLYGIRGDNKIDKTFYSNRSDNTLQYIPVSSTGILNWTNTYSSSPFKPAYSSIPSDLGERYIKKDALDNSGCMDLCNSMDNCSHYYSYTVGGDNTVNSNKFCLVNTDSKPPNMFSPDAGLNVKKSSLNIRNQMIKSTCIHSRFPVSVYPEGPVVSEGKLDAYSLYSGYSFLPSANQTPAQEGVCSEPIIVGQLKKLFGTESFEGHRRPRMGSVPNEVGYNRPRESKVTDLESVTPVGNQRSWLQLASLVKDSEGQNDYDSYNPTATVSTLPFLRTDAKTSGLEGFVPGYNRDVKCEQGSDMVQCKAGIENNIKVLSDYGVEYKKWNDDINTKDATLSSDITTLKANVDNVKDKKYEVIDDQGNLTYTDDFKKNASLKIHDVMINDNNEMLIQQNSLYIVGTITAATLLIAAIMIGKG